MQRKVEALINLSREDQIKQLNDINKVDLNNLIDFTKKIKLQVKDDLQNVNEIAINFSNELSTTHLAATSTSYVIAKNKEISDQYELLLDKNRKLNNLLTVLNILKDIYKQRDIHFFESKKDHSLQNGEIKENPILKNKKIF